MIPSASDLVWFLVCFCWMDRETNGKEYITVFKKRTSVSESQWTSQTCSKNALVPCYHRECILFP